MVASLVPVEAFIRVPLDVRHNLWQRVFDHCPERYIWLADPEIGVWTHVVATFSNGQDCPVFRNDATTQLSDSRVTQNGEGEPNFSVGGLQNYEGHIVDAYIAEVRTYNIVLSADQVRARFLSTCERYDACPHEEIGTASACTAPAAVAGLEFALDAACQQWSASVHRDAGSRWYSLAGDTSLGVSTDGLQYGDTTTQSKLPA